MQQVQLPKEGSLYAHLLLKFMTATSLWGSQNITADYCTA